MQRHGETKTWRDIQETKRETESEIRRPKDRHFLSKDDQSQLEGWEEEAESKRGGGEREMLRDEGSRHPERGSQRLAKVQKLCELAGVRGRRTVENGEEMQRLAAARQACPPPSEVLPPRSAPIWASCLDWESLGSPSNRWKPAPKGVWS